MLKQYYLTFLFLFLFFVVCPCECVKKLLILFLLALQYLLEFLLKVIVTPFNSRVLNTEDKRYGEKGWHTILSQKPREWQLEQ